MVLLATMGFDGFVRKITGSLPNILNMVRKAMAPILTIVDDSILEIPVSLDSREMAQWFPFGNGADRNSAGNSDTGARTANLETTEWYAPLAADPKVEIYWSENRTCAWRGRLARVESQSGRQSGFGHEIMQRLQGPC